MSRFTKPSAAAEAASGSWFKPAEHVNELLLFKPLEHKRDLENPFHDPKDEKSNATRDGVTGDVVVLRDSPQEYAGQTFVQASLIASLKGALGGMVLGRLVKVKSGVGFKYALADASKIDEDIAERYLATVEDAPF